MGRTWKHLREIGSVLFYQKIQGEIMAQSDNGSIWVMSILTTLTNKSEVIVCNQQATAVDIR